MSVRYLPPRTENFITERVHIICKLNLYIDVIYNLNIVDCLIRVLDVVLPLFSSDEIDFMIEYLCTN